MLLVSVAVLSDAIAFDDEIMGGGALETWVSFAGAATDGSIDPPCV